MICQFNCTLHFIASNLLLTQLFSRISYRMQRYYKFYLFTLYFVTHNFPNCIKRRKCYIL